MCPDSKATTTTTTTTTMSTTSSNDKTRIHSFLFEFPTEKSSHILTKEGLENIATHKYVGGEYTYLDDFMNPIWTYLTSLLPLWIAPNMITTIGGMHCLLAYFVLWYKSPNMDADVELPNWVFFLSAYCAYAYYTLDCMDGKQSRRTNTSSPLGQLFDHGMDCFCNLVHPALAAAYLMNGGTYFFFKLMSPLQFAFFTAQWEEYYTHVLPHGCGKWFGVTEVNYGLATISLVNAFLDRKAFWFQSVEHALPDIVLPMLKLLPFQNQVENVLSLQLNEAGINGWYLLIISQCLLSFKRTLAHTPTMNEKLSALSKLVSPLILAYIPFLLPHHLIQHHTRLVSIAMGLVFDLITKKMIVFSMAKMSFAMLQLEILPFMILTVIMQERFLYSAVCKGCDEGQENELDVLILKGICVWHVYRLVRWCRLAILQITDRLDIYCFTIKKQKKSM